MEYSYETLRAWQAGDITELAYYLNDKAGQGTFFKWIDVELGYDYPSFVSGDETLFEQHHRMLVEIGQNR